MSNRDIKIDGVLIPSPVDWNPGIKDLVTNSTRTGSGKMRFTKVATKRTWDAQWKNLNSSELALLMSCIEPNAFFTIECFDPGVGSVVTKTFYKGDRNFDSLKHLSESEIYASLSLNFIEQ